MHVDQEEEIIRLIDLREGAAKKLEAYEPGTEGYEDALKAVVELSRTIDAAEKRYFEEYLTREKHKADLDHKKAELAARRSEFEEQQRLRQKEFKWNIGTQIGFGIVKLGMAQGQMNMEYDGKLLLTGPKAKDFVRDAMRIPDRIK